MLPDLKEIAIYVYNVYPLKDSQPEIEVISTMKSDDTGDYISAYHLKSLFFRCCLLLAQ